MQKFTQLPRSEDELIEANAHSMLHCWCFIHATCYGLKVDWYTFLTNIRHHQFTAMISQKKLVLLHFLLMLQCNALAQLVMAWKLTDMTFWQISITLSCKKDQWKGDGATCCCLKFDWSKLLTNIHHTQKDVGAQCCTFCWCLIGATCYGLKFDWSLIRFFDKYPSIRKMHIWAQASATCFGLNVDWYTFLTNINQTQF